MMIRHGSIPPRNKIRESQNQRIREIRDLGRKNKIAEQKSGKLEENVKKPGAPPQGAYGASDHSLPLCTSVNL